MLLSKPPLAGPLEVAAQPREDPRRLLDLDTLEREPQPVGKEAARDDGRPVAGLRRPAVARQGTISICLTGNIP